MVLGSLKSFAYISWPHLNFLKLVNSAKPSYFLCEMYYKLSAGDLLCAFLGGGDRASMECLCALCCEEIECWSFRRRG